MSVKTPDILKPHYPEPNIFCVQDYPGNLFRVNKRIELKWAPNFKEWSYEDCSHTMLESWFLKFPHLFLFHNSIFPPSTVEPAAETEPGPFDEFLSSPPPIQQEAEKPNLEDTIQWMSQQAMKNMSEAANNMQSSYYDGYLDALTELAKEMEITKPAPAQQEAIPEDFRKWAKAYADGNSIDAPPTVAEWLNPELFQAALNTYRHLNPLSSPPFVKTEREEDKWKFHCWKEFGGGERCDTLCRTCSGEDFGSEKKSQPSPIVQERDDQDPIEKWIDEYVGKFASFRSKNQLAEGIAIAMYHKMRVEINQLNRWRKEGKAYSEMLEDKLTKMDAELSALKKERDDYKHLLKTIATNWWHIPDDLARQVRSLIAAYSPTPQTPK